MGVGGGGGAGGSRGLWREGGGCNRVVLSAMYSGEKEVWPGGGERKVCRRGGGGKMEVKDHVGAEGEDWRPEWLLSPF